MSTSTITTPRPLFGNLHQPVSDAARQNSALLLQELGFDYDVVKVPAMVGEGYGRTQVEQVDNQFHLLRDVSPCKAAQFEDGRILSPHTVSRIYATLTPRDITGVFDYMVAEGFGEYDSAWLDKGGTHECIAVRINVDNPIPGDASPMQYYLLGLNKHAMGAIRFTTLAFRPGCSNMFGWCFSNAPVALKHTTNVQSRLAFAERFWQRAVKQIQERVNVMGELAKQSIMQHGGQERVANLILGIDPSKRITGQAERKRTDLIVRMNDPAAGTGNGSLYDALNAVTSQNTHWGYGKVKTTQAIVNSIIDSTRGKNELEALKVLCKLAGIDL